MASIKNLLTSKIEYFPNVCNAYELIKCISEVSSIPTDQLVIWIDDIDKSHRKLHKIPRRQFKKGYISGRLILWNCNNLTEKHAVFDLKQFGIKPTTIINYIASTDLNGGELCAVLGGASAGTCCLVIAGLCCIGCVCVACIGGLALIESTGGSKRVYGKRERSLFSGTAQSERAISRSSNRSSSSSGGLYGSHSNNFGAPPSGKGDNFARNRYQGSNFGRPVY